MPPAPFFLVLGTSRSGTSLVTALLDAHSQLAMGSELFRDEILRGLHPSWRGRSPHERLAGFVGACHREAARHVPVRWGNKITTEMLYRGVAEPGWRDHAGVVELVRRLPAVQTVFVCRDRRATVASKMERGGDSFAKASRHWTLAGEIRTELHRQHRPTWTVHYEDLVRAPATCVESMCSALGVPYEPAMLAATGSPLLLPAYRRASFGAAATLG